MTKLKFAKIQQHRLNTNTNIHIKDKGINSINKYPIKINFDSKQIKIETPLQRPSKDAIKKKLIDKTN